MHLDRLRDRMNEEQVDVMVLSDPHNVEWCLDADVSGYLVVTRDSATLVMPRFHRFAEIPEGVEAEFYFSREECREALARVSETVQGDSMCDEKDEELDEFFAADEMEMVSRLRQSKTPEEIRRMEKACSITDKAFAELVHHLFTGMTEWEALSHLKQFYCERKLEESFIVSGGSSLVQANCLKPHRGPEDREIEPGDLVIVDTGARYSGYGADVTRTYCADPSDEQRELFEAVKETQEELLEMIAPGTPVSDVKERELELVESHGYSRENVIYTSHGFGREVHEPPTFSMDSEEEFKENMLVTVEPGIHVEGLGGARIEDTVLVTSEGCRQLSGAPKDLQPPQL